MTSRGSNRPPGGNPGKRGAADPRAEPETMPPAASPSRSAAPTAGRSPLRDAREGREAHIDTPSGGMATTHKQMASLQMQLAEAQRHMAQHQEERAADTDRLAEMLKRLSRTELRARAAEAGLTEAAQRASVAEQRMEELHTQRTLDTGEAEKLARVEKLLEESAKNLAELESAMKAKDEELAGLRSDLNEAMEVADAKEKQVETLVVEIDALQTVERDLTKTLRERLEDLDRLTKSTELLTKSNAELETLRASVDAAGLENLRLEEELDGTKRESERALSALTNNLNAEFATKTTELKEELTEKLTTMLTVQHEKAVAVIRAEDEMHYDTVTGKLEARSRELHATEKKLEEASAAMATLQTEIADAKKIVEAERAACEAAREDSATLRSALNDARAEAENRNKTVKALNDNVGKATASLEALERAEGELAKARAKVAEHVKALRGSLG